MCIHAHISSDYYDFASKPKKLLKDMAHQGICKDDENITWNKLLDYRTNFEENMSLIQTSVAIANVNAKKYRCELP